MFELKIILFATALVLTCLSGCLLSKDALPYRPFKSAIIPKRDKIYIPKEGLEFKPTKRELGNVERILRKAFDKEMLHENFEVKIPLKHYNRQYFGYLNEKGGKIVFVQCFEKSHYGKGDEWRTFIVHPDDFCNGIFRLTINLKTGTYSNFSWNPCS